ncbi:phage tail protein [Pseudomonas tolaasii]|uniref:Phage tail protein n=2 Tax=Pseudomonas tolaasii TaxID=29442 RepID=A0A7Y8AQ34_PSETO|nr:phage tail protein [Pseudomonas tolaasii]ARB26961.1 oxidoreductase [Pseudomonas tolaasii]KAB0469996.1 phage tail protein [Pseudomonas tolaasii]MBY8941537.1 phage tail protein [Pseudomonas tolaasii]NWC21579.1 phage tail protein [Pseudomonas tolaasii]NWC38774.1 phage tail protein [Pseudomonas tolaasii]
MMLSLGMFVFSLSTLAYQELQRQTNWRHASNSRVGAPPALQFVGRGDDTVTLPGIILPELAGSVLSLDALRLMANTGKAWPMVEGTGRIYGLWVIESLSETKNVFFRDGTPRRIEFTLTLKRTDDDRIDLLGAATSTGLNILRGLL